MSENLYEDLVVLYGLIEQSRYLLWIDAICINQDIPEHNSQIHLMKYIYETATNVF